MRPIKLKNVAKDLRGILNIVPTTDSNGLGKLYGAVAKKIKR